MASYAGKYYYERSQGLEEYVKKIAGVAAAEIGKYFFEENKPFFEYSYSDDKYTFTYYSGDRKYFNSFKLDQEFDGKTFFDAVYKTTVHREGDKFTFSSKLPGGNFAYAEYTFSSDGFKVYYYEEKYGVKAYSYYKRV